MQLFNKNLRYPLKEESMGVGRNHISSRWEYFIFFSAKMVSAYILLQVYALYV
jgi:hypothetical protein